MSRSSCNTWNIHIFESIFILCICYGILFTYWNIKNMKSIKKYKKKKHSLLIFIFLFYVVPYNGVMTLNGVNGDDVVIIIKINWFIDKLSVLWVWIIYIIKFIIINAFFSNIYFLLCPSKSMPYFLNQKSA